MMSRAIRAWRAFPEDQRRGICPDASMTKTPATAPSAPSSSAAGGRTSRLDVPVLDARAGRAGGTVGALPRDGSTRRSSSSLVMLAGLAAIAASRSACGFLVTRVVEHAWGIGAADERFNVWLAAHRTPPAQTPRWSARSSPEGSCCRSSPASIALVLRRAAAVADRGVRRRSRWPSSPRPTGSRRSSSTRIGPASSVSRTCRSTPATRPGTRRRRSRSTAASSCCSRRGSRTAPSGRSPGRSPSRWWRSSRWSRMYRGMHHPLDVAGGVVVGVAALIVVVFACRTAGAAAEAGRARAAGARHEGRGHRALRQDARRRAARAPSRARGRGRRRPVLVRGAEEPQGAGAGSSGRWTRAPSSSSPGAATGWSSAASTSSPAPDASLAIIPAGTANLFATNLGIPKDIEQAVAVGLRGERRQLDVGRFNGERFAVMAGAGFDAAMIRDAGDGGLKERLGRVAYVWTGSENLRVEAVPRRDQGRRRRLVQGQGELHPARQRRQALRRRRGVRGCAPRRREARARCRDGRGAARVGPHARANSGRDGEQLSVRPDDEGHAR